MWAHEEFVPEGWIRGEPLAIQHPSLDDGETFGQITRRPSMDYPPFGGNFMLAGCPAVAFHFSDTTQVEEWIEWWKRGMT